MQHPASLATRLALSLGVFILVLAASGVYVASQTPATRPAGVDREYILESSMLGYRGVGGDIDGVRNPTLWARTGESVRITIVNAELMVHDIALEGLNIKSPQILDKAARTNITFTADQERHLLLLGARPSAGGHGRAHRGLRRAARALGGRPGAGQRPHAQPGLRERHARRLDGDGRRVRARHWAMSCRGNGLTRAAERPAPTGSAATSAGAARKGTLTSVPFRVNQPYASFLVSGGAFTSTRVDLVLASGVSQSAPENEQVIFTISGNNSATMRPVVVDLKDYMRQGHRRPAGGRRDRFHGRGLPQRESVGAHHLRSFPLSRRQAVLPHRDHRVRDQGAAAHGPCPARGPLGRRRGEGHDRAEGLHRQARRRRAGRRAADRLRARRPRPAVGRGSAHLSQARARGPGPRPHPDLRGHQRRRPSRQPQGLHREPEPRQRHRGRLRRRLGRRGAVPDVHPDQGRHRSAGGSAADPARRLGLPGHARDAQHVHVGARRLALRHARRLHAFERRQARAPGTASASG